MPSKTTILRSRDVNRLQAWCRVELLMQEEEFYRLTPAAFARIHKQWAQKEMRADLRVARLCWVAVLCRTGISRPLKDFLPVYKQPVKRKFKTVDSNIVFKQLLAIIPPHQRPKTHGK